MRSVLRMTVARCPTRKVDMDDLSLGLLLASLVVRSIDASFEAEMARYSKKSATKVKRALHEMKRGKLKSGVSGKTVSSRKQAIAIGLSEARRAGAKLPASSARKKSLKRKSAKKK